VKKNLWLIPIIIALSVYSVAFNNFFVYDDFIWLYRAKTLTQNWSQILSIDVIYFDPLIYLMFLFDYSIAGLDPRWYHSVDLTIHAANAFLVYRLGKMLSGDEKTTLYGSVLFASSFAIADAILWPSSRVDLVSVMFSLGTLILFLKYLQANNLRYLLLSCFLFVLSLGAKGTPVVIPLILIWLLFMDKKPFHRYLSVIPFGLLVFLYFALLKMTIHNTAKQTIDFHFNIRNLSLALSELFIPERHLAILDPFICATLLALLVITFCFLRFNSELSYRLRITGFVILVGALLPVLVIRDFKLATKGQYAINLLSSPSHRIYFASVGSALIGGGILRSLESLFKRFIPKTATLMTALFLVGIIIFSAIEVRKRNQIWEYVGVATRIGLNGLMKHREKIVEDGVVGLVQFPGPNGFMSPMIKVYLDLNNVTTYQFFNMKGLEDQELLEKADKSSFFILGMLGNDLLVYDLSDQFKRVLYLCKKSIQNPLDQEYRKDCESIATQLNHEILTKIHQ
jgi:hypothetical protein